MKTVIDAVNEYKGEIGNNTSFIYYCVTGWAGLFCASSSREDGKLICTADEFNKCVEEMTNMNIKPVYTKEMVDAGVMPSVGMECQTSTGIVTVRYIGKNIVVSDDDENCEFTMSKKGALHSLKPLDTRTDTEKAIDNLMFFGDQSQTSILATETLNAIKVGKIHGVTWSGK